MIIDVILGNNIDTPLWIANSKRNKVDCIILVDYEYKKEPEDIDGVIYMSTSQAQNYIKLFDKVNYYISMYAYPGMQGNMSSLYKKDNN